MDKAKFMGEEPILPLLIKLSLPATIAMMVNSLYNVVDTIFVGKGVGDLAIAALSIAFPIQMFIGAVSQAIGIGASSIVSRRLGENKREEAAMASGTAITFSLLTGLLMIGFLLLFTDPILRTFGALDSIFPLCKEYITWVAPGFFFLSFAMSSSALVRAEGNAKVAMVSMLLGAITNIILDPIFIFGFNMGIKGAAVATVIGQVLSFAYLLRFFFGGQNILKLRLNHFMIRKKVLLESFLLGLPNFIQMSGISLLIMIANNQFGTYGGENEISSYGMISRIFSLLILPLLGIVQGFQPIAGYNYGAKLFKRVKEVLVTTVALSSLLAVVGWSLLMGLPKLLISLFTDSSELVNATAGSLRIYSSVLFLLGLQLTGATYFQSIGKKAASLVLSLSRQFIILIPLLIILPPIIGLSGVWYSFPIADGVSAVVTVSALLLELRHLSGKEKILIPEEALE